MEYNVGYHKRNEQH